MARIKRKVAAAAILLLQEKVKKKNRKRVWVRKWIERRSVEGAHVKLLRELLNEDTVSYNNFLRMSPEDYYHLLDKVTPIIKKEDTHLRKAISPSERLALTLRYLASG